MKAKTKKLIEEFGKLLDVGIDKIYDASCRYVAALDSDPDAYDHFGRSRPDIPKSVWYALESVGRGMLDKRLLFGGGHAKNKLKRMPVSKQKQALDNGLEVLINGETLIVKPDQMTAPQVGQVFGLDKVRTIAEQKNYVQRKREKDTTPPPVQYEIVRKKLIVHEPMTLSLSELKGIMRNMEK